MHTPLLFSLSPLPSLLVSPLKPPNIPQRDVDKLYGLYTTITHKYRKLLEEESLLQEATQKLYKMQEESDQSQAELADCQKQLLLKTQRYE